MMMKSARLIKNNSRLEITDIPMLTVVGNEVLAKVVAAGICHSDLHIWSGSYDLGAGKQLELSKRGVPMPLTMGHEIAGEVVDTGDLAVHIKVGESVIGYPWVG